MATPTPSSTPLRGSEDTPTEHINNTNNYMFIKRVQVSAGPWVQGTGAPQGVQPGPQTQLKAAGPFGAAAGEEAGLVGLQGRVGQVVQVGGQGVLLVRLLRLRPFTPVQVQVHGVGVLTVDHGHHAVPSLVTGGPVRDHLHRDGVALVGLQLRDEVTGGISAGAARVDQDLGVLVKTLDGVGVVVGLWGAPGAADGGGALGATVEAVDSLRFYGKTQVQVQVLKMEY
ncbi:hypothetical protein EYF80_031106 [Liparis tanakae]|uniref:Uncharacterized protein n=1 Tax=Liparis tanakae TaxID=230148 RepID=A0A4Z2H1B8_9TELE|nr:hypothetical protein EYF80_031106 [Liparis tanakae]